MGILLAFAAMEQNNGGEDVIFHFLQEGERQNADYTEASSIYFILLQFPKLYYVKNCVQKAFEKYICCISFYKT